MVWGSTGGQRPGDRLVIALALCAADPAGLDSGVSCYAGRVFGGWFCGRIPCKAFVIERMMLGQGWPMRFCF